MLHFRVQNLHLMEFEYGVRVEHICQIETCYIVYGHRRYRSPLRTPVGRVPEPLRYQHGIRIGTYYPLSRYHYSGGRLVD
jgi:hypothetical protein